MKGNGNEYLLKLTTSICFEGKNTADFWPHISNELPWLRNKVLQNFIQFPTTYL